MRPVRPLRPRLAFSPPVTFDVRVVARSARKGRPAVFIYVTVAACHHSSPLSRRRTRFQARVGSSARFLFSCPNLFTPRDRPRVLDRSVEPSLPAPPVPPETSRRCTRLPGPGRVRRHRQSDARDDPRRKAARIGPPHVPRRRRAPWAEPLDSSARLPNASENISTTGVDRLTCSIPSSFETFREGRIRRCRPNPFRDVPAEL